jgi:hypothetical protein
MLRPNPIIRLVADAPFDAADVIANGQAHLSAEQHRRLQRQRNRRLGLWVGALLGWLLLTEALWVHPGLAAAGAAIMMAALVLNGLQCHDDLSMAVMMVQGAAQTDSRGLLPSRLRVGDQSFALPRRWQRLLTAGATYRVYYTAGSHTLLSAEYASLLHAPSPTRHMTGRLR